MNERGYVLVVDDEPNILKTLKIGLEAIGLKVDGFLNPLEAIEQLTPSKYDIAFIDLMMQPIDGMQVLKEIRQRSPFTTCVIITAHGSIDSAVEAIKSGAFDFLQKPFDLKEVQLFAEKVLAHHQLQSEVANLRRQLSEKSSASNIITRNQTMQQQLDLAKQVADSLLTVLIEGESGTGKEMVAQYIHNQSSRHGKAFIKVNCAALPENLLESELFGHVKGAFTGAIKDREGRFEAANEGTIFLDEIADIPPSSQVKLLRFLQHREFERVGENITRKVDVRVITATNRQLSESLKVGSFREDLYYRINSVKINLPPLRERSEDIILLIYHFISKFSNNNSIEVSSEAMKMLTSYSWPGNVRELENIIERAVLLTKQGKIEVSHLPSELLNPEATKAGLLSLEALERYHISKVLKVVKDLDEASKVLGIDPATLWRKRKKFGLSE
ncbi:MAG: sigma-54-dependent Fis family transcriptional regulator [Ignavibacteriales bacterium]|nr:sigma-54-dependent Fis family transcriptional regulator [Ignavibacteriales bacterium]